MKTIQFVNGPIDGQTRTLRADQTVYLHEQPPVANDIRIGEIPVGFFPPMHEYIYEEDPAQLGTFIFKEQHHQ